MEVNGTEREALGEAMTPPDRATPEAVQRLRERTGSGMLDCAWALRSTFTEEQAAGLLRFKGNAVATKPGHPDLIVRYLRDLVPPPEALVLDPESGLPEAADVDVLRSRAAFYIAEIERLKAALAEREKDYQHVWAARVRAEEALYHSRADAARYRFLRARTEWSRRTERVGWDEAADAPVEEEWTHLQVRVLNGANLSCAGMVDHAVDAAMRDAGEGGEPSPATAAAPRVSDDAFERTLDDRLRDVSDTVIRRAIRNDGLGPFLDVEDLRAIILGRRAEESIGARWAAEVLGEARRAEVTSMVIDALTQEPDLLDVRVGWEVPSEEGDWHHVMQVMLTGRIDHITGEGLTVETEVALMTRVWEVCAGIMSVDERLRSQVFVNFHRPTRGHLA